MYPPKALCLKWQPFLLLLALLLLAGQARPSSREINPRFRLRELDAGDTAFVKVSLQNIAGRVIALCQTQPELSSAGWECTSDLLAVKIDVSKGTTDDLASKLRIHGLPSTKSLLDWSLLSLPDEDSYLLAYTRGHGPRSGAYGYFPAVRKVSVGGDKLSFDGPESIDIGDFRRTDRCDSDSLSAARLSNDDILVVGALHSEMWFTISHDNGKTWTKVTALVERGNKPQLVRAGDKCLVFFWQFTENHMWRVYSMETIDGKKWHSKREIASYKVSLEDIKTAISKRAHVGALSVCWSEDTQLIYLIYRLTVAAKPRLYLIVGDREGSRWSKPTRIHVEIEGKSRPSVAAESDNLIIAFEDEDGHIQYTVVSAEEIGKPDMTEIARIPTKEEITREHKAEIPKVLELLNKEDITDQQRRKAVVRLMSIGDESCVPTLIEHVDEKYPRLIRRQAIVALGNIGDRRAVPLLLDILREPVGGNTEDEGEHEAILRRQCVLSLLRIKDPAALPTLQAIVDSKKEYQSVRELATIAVKRITDKARSDSAKE